MGVQRLRACARGALYGVNGLYELMRYDIRHKDRCHNNETTTRPWRRFRARGKYFVWRGRSTCHICTARETKVFWCLLKDRTYPSNLYMYFFLKRKKVCTPCDSCGIAKRNGGAMGGVAGALYRWTTSQVGTFGDADARHTSSMMLTGDACCHGRVRIH